MRPIDGHLIRNVGMMGRVDGCDGEKEPLRPSSSLMICGDGTVQFGESTFTARVSGKIWVEEVVNGISQQTSLCAGLHEFTFERTKG
jgi:hypothetical protein